MKQIRLGIGIRIVKKHLYQTSYVGIVRATGA